MKTKVLNFVMPVFVFIMAMGLAFATEKADDGQIGYYKDLSTGIVEEVEVDCDSAINEDCKVNGYPVFAERSLDTPLYKSMKH